MSPRRRNRTSARKPRKRSSARRPRKRTTAARKRPPAKVRRRRRNVLLATAVVVVLAGLGWYGGDHGWWEDLLPEQVRAGPDRSTEDDRSGGDADGDVDGDTGGDVDADRAREQLAELTVADWASTSGYSRDRFSHWRTEDGCDARQTVLQRDGEDIEMDSENCRVTSGTWFSPFDEVTLTDPSDVDIDHLVPLANAWRTGAQEWDDDRRADFANDLDTPQLIAVSASSNRAKGDQDPSQWQPARSYWCQYAHDWVVVKHYWELWVTAPERDTLADMLDTCD